MSSASQGDHRILRRAGKYIKYRWIFPGPVRVLIISLIGLFPWISQMLAELILSPGQTMHGWGGHLHFPWGIRVETLRVWWLWGGHRTVFVWCCEWWVGVRQQEAGCWGAQRVLGRTLVCPSLSPHWCASSAAPTAHPEEPSFLGVRDWLWFLRQAAGGSPAVRVTHEQFCFMSRRQTQL